jgi:hypothetical protein
VGNDLHTVRRSDSEKKRNIVPILKEVRGEEI